MAIGAAIYATQPYGAHIYDTRIVMARLGIPLIVPTFSFTFGPQVGVYNPPAARGRIVGTSTVTGNLGGGIYIPPPIPGGGTGFPFSGDVRCSTSLTVNLSGGRPVVKLVGTEFGRTYTSATMSGGKHVVSRVWIYPQPISGHGALYGVMDGGEEFSPAAGSTSVTATMSGGVNATAVIQMHGDLSYGEAAVQATMSGGRAVVALQGSAHCVTSVLAKINPAGFRPFVQLRGSVYTQSVYTGNLTGGRNVQPPPSGGGPGTGVLVQAGSINMSAAWTLTLTGQRVQGPDFPPGGPSDLPTGVDQTVPSNPTVDLLEAIGYGAQGPKSEVLLAKNQMVNLYGQDAHSTDDPAAFAIPANNDGSPTYSFERWVRVRFIPPFGLIGQFRFWVDPMDIPDGWDIRWGWSNTYQVPTSGESQIAVSPIPTADPGPVWPNFGNPGSVDGQQTRYSPYLVLQASFLPDATQPGDSIEPLPGLIFNIAYLQS